MHVFNFQLEIKTRSSATAEKQRVSCAYVYSWLTDRAVHRTPQNRKCIVDHVKRPKRAVR